MNSQFASWYIPLRMKDLGIKSFIVRYKTFVVIPTLTLQINADNEFYFVLDPPNFFEIKSKAGICYLNGTTNAEMQYEHRGEIIVRNLGVLVAHIHFIQVIPKNE